MLLNDEMRASSLRSMPSNRRYMPSSFSSMTSADSSRYLIAELTSSILSERCWVSRDRFLIARRGLANCPPGPALHPVKPDAEVIELGIE